MLHDPELSVQAKGTLSYLFSLPDPWDLDHSRLAKALGIGKDSLRSIIKELIEKGYLETTETSSPQG